MRIRVEFIGGPLDGAVQTQEVASAQFLGQYWCGPDPSQDGIREKKAIIYELVPDDPSLLERKRKFSPKMTDMKNLQGGYDGP